MTNPTKYVIRQTRFFYGPRTERSLIEDGHGVVTFATAAEARAHVSQIDAAPYYTAQNECGRPKYTVRRAN